MHCAAIQCSLLWGRERQEDEGREEGRTLLNVPSNGSHMTSPALFPILVSVSSLVEQSLNGQVHLSSALPNVMTYRTNGTIITRTFAGNNWSEPHNVKFCLHGMYVSPYVTVNSAGH